MAHGVRKVDEYLIKNGRAIIFTSNINSLDSNETWDSIENGSLYINPDFGTLRYKNSLSEKVYGIGLKLKILLKKIQ